MRQQLLRARVDVRFKKNMAQLTEKLDLVKRANIRKDGALFQDKRVTEDGENDDLWDP